MKVISDKLSTTNRELFDHAKKFIPGGVNSPVRSFSSVGASPVFIKRAEGSRLYSEDGREFIDYCMSWGAMLLGHAHPEVVSALGEAIQDGTSYGAATPYETELAEMITEAVPSIEKVRLTSSGTEAVMGAIRLARGYTGRDKIIKFEGSYHGHADYLLANAGSGLASFGIPSSSGVPEDFTKHTIVAPYNDPDKLYDVVEKYSGEVAAIIVEPVLANSGLILPEDGFLEELRNICDKEKIVLVFDEVITGFRLSYGGAQELYGIKPDITTLGKIIGGGLPVGAFGGKNEIMLLLAPEGNVYQAGTLSGNPLAVRAGISTLKVLKELDPYSDLDRKVKHIATLVANSADRAGVDVTVNSIGSLFSIFFTSRRVKDFTSGKSQDTELFGRFFRGLLKEGVYFSPSGFEVEFLSVAHTDKDIDMTVDIIDETLKKL